MIAGEALLRHARNSDHAEVVIVADGDTLDGSTRHYCTILSAPPGDVPAIVDVVCGHLHRTPRAAARCARRVAVDWDGLVHAAGCHLVNGDRTIEWSARVEDGRYLGWVQRASATFSTNRVITDLMGRVTDLTRAG